MQTAKKYLDEHEGYGEHDGYGIYILSSKAEKALDMQHNESVQACIDKVASQIMNQKYLLGVDTAYSICDELKTLLKPII